MSPCTGTATSSRLMYTVSPKKRTNFEKVLLDIEKIDFDEIWLKCSQDCRIEFACFSFYVGLLFINFLPLKPETENSANFDAVSSSVFCVFWCFPVCVIVQLPADSA